MVSPWSGSCGGGLGCAVWIPHPNISKTWAGKSENMLRSSWRSPAADQDSVVSPAIASSRHMQTQLSSSKLRHGYMTIDRQLSSKALYMFIETGLLLSTTPGTLPSFSIMVADGRVNRNADWPDGRAVLNAASPTINGRMIDLIPSAAIQRIGFDAHDITSPRRYLPTIRSARTTSPDANEIVPSSGSTSLTSHPHLTVAASPPTPSIRAVASLTNSLLKSDRW